MYTEQITIQIKQSVKVDLEISDGIDHTNIVKLTGMINQLINRMVTSGNKVDYQHYGHELTVFGINTGGSIDVFIIDGDSGTVYL